MSKNTFNRYLWFIETFRRHGRLTRQQLNELWRESPYSEGEDLPRRTFYAYRNDIAEIFGLNIECNQSTYEYYISDLNGTHHHRMTDWMLSTASMSNVLAEASQKADRVFLEDVPSARLYLSAVISAMKGQRALRFNYSPFSRTGAPKPVEVEPYFLKIFRQRWYVTGRNVREKAIKTYALDRMTDVTISDTTFTIPANFNAEAYFNDSFGVIFTKAPARKVTIRTDARMAKYLRALPLHHSQSEMIHDDYSIFTYRLRLTPDFVGELLSHGPSITVLAPLELRAMMVESLTQSLENYKK